MGIQRERHCSESVAVRKKVLEGHPMEVSPHAKQWVRQVERIGRERAECYRQRMAAGRETEAYNGTIYLGHSMKFNISQS